MKADVRAFADIDALSAAAAGAAAGLLAEAAAARGRSSLALSGGNTPATVYRLLASQFREQIPWSRVHVFWGDERYVPEDHVDSNYRMARELMLDHVPCPAENIHPMPTQVWPASEAAARYENLLRGFFSGRRGPAFDLNILGVGEDAHTASIFPGSPAVDEQDRWVMDVETPGALMKRLTLTLPALSHSANIHVLVAGGAKARALRQALNTEADPRLYPASGIRSSGSLVWWVDSAAARTPPT